MFLKQVSVQCLGYRSKASASESSTQESLAFVPSACLQHGYENHVTVKYRNRNPYMDARVQLDN